MKKLKRFFTRKVFTTATLLILLDATIGAAAVEYFDIISLSEQYSVEILLSIFSFVVFFLTIKLYQRRKFQTNKKLYFKGYRSDNDKAKINL